MIVNPVKMGGKQTIIDLLRQDTENTNCNSLINRKVRMIICYI